MHKKLQIGIVGCGAIGSSLAKVICSKFNKDASLAALFDTNRNKVSTLIEKLRLDKNIMSKNLSGLIKKSNLVIECASASCSFQIARDALLKRKSIMIMSVGGILQDIKKLSALARKNGAKIYIPSGAVSGIDGLKAANVFGIDEITLTTRKHPDSFGGVKYIADKKIRLDNLKKDKVIFSGSAFEAVKYFPQNINVAAVISLAGIGGAKTRIKIIASPKSRKNIHEIEIKSKAAHIKSQTENVLHPDNPKTSFLAVLSAVATLKQILEPIRVGT